jgi:hypothetical protein
MAGEHDKRRLVEWLRVEIQRQTGRRYDRLDLESLDPESLREFQRLLRDLDAERRMAVQRVRICPWR